VATRPSRQFVVMKTIALLLLVVLSLESTGCMLIGAGIGAAVPRYAEGSPTEGEQVQVSSMQGAQVSGRLTESDLGTITVTPHEGAPVVIPKGDIAKIKRYVGSYATKGFEIGTMVDLTLAFAATFAGMAWVSLAAVPANGMR